MAATFTVEDGTGLANANAYCSTAFADQYNDDHEQNATWSGLSTANKEKHIRLATQFLEVHYRGRWLGVRKLSTQALHFPAYDLDVDSLGTAYSSSEVPQPVEEATAYLAIQSALGKAFSVVPTDGAVQTKTVKVGPIEIEKEYAGSYNSGPAFPYVDSMLRELINGGNGVYRS